MKRLITLLLAIIPATIFAQDKIHTIDGKTLEVKIVEIGDKEIVYKDFSYQDGPSYKLSTSEISGIILQDGKELVLNSLPEGFTMPTRISSRRGDVYGDGVKLPEESLIYVLGQDGFDSISSGFRLRKAANILTWSGLGSIGIGISIASFNASETDNGEDSDAGLVAIASSFIGIGAACLITSIPLRSAGHRKIDNVVDNYNRKASLSFGATSHGIGLALNF